MIFVESASLLYGILNRYEFRQGGDTM